MLYTYDQYRGLRRLLVTVIGILTVIPLAPLINRYIPMASSIKTILNIVVVVAVCVWVLQAAGLWGNITGHSLTR